MAIVLFLMSRLTRELEPDKRLTLVGTAAVIFALRAIPQSGPGATWWMIDHLNFDQQFLSVLSLIGGMVALVGMFVFRRLMAERSITYIVGFLTVVGTILSLPVVGMFYGVHEWTARLTGGVVDARFIALVDTALESPLVQISMIPMLAWIANSAPANLKATFFAVMASFTNLALSFSQLGTKYLNEIFVVTREVRDQSTGTDPDTCRLQSVGRTVHRATVARPGASLLRHPVCQAHQVQERVSRMLNSAVGFVLASLKPSTYLDCTPRPFARCGLVAQRF